VDVDDGENARHFECVRCKRTVARADLARVAIPIPSPVAEPAQHLLCSRCADEVQRGGLLRLLAEREPLRPPVLEEQTVSSSIAARAGWFALRMVTYGLIAFAVFALVTWLSVR
jgi:hypothetical protein